MSVTDLAEYRRHHHDGACCPACGSPWLVLMAARLDESLRLRAWQGEVYCASCGEKITGRMEELLRHR